MCYLNLLIFHCLLKLEAQRIEHRTEHSTSGPERGLQSIRNSLASQAHSNVVDVDYNAIFQIEL